MKAISTVLVPFDFSDVASNALNYAIRFLENDPQVKIILAHVEDGAANQEKLPELKKIIQTYSRKIRNEIIPVITKGRINESLLEIQRTTSVDLVIMGTCPLKDHCFLQTKTSEFVLAAKCPVLVIPKGYHEFHLERISLVIGKDEIHNYKLLGVLLDVARRFNAHVDVITVKNDEGNYGYTPTDEKNENNIEYYLENFYSHHSFIEDPDILHGIFNYVDKNKVDLIAMLPRNHAEGPVHSEGKLTRELSQTTEVPLLAIDF
ncbi:universal stress protein [Robertkochia solimangrovi]|uniref:universal stress protein n=1 Tax=Robertkochia solimangrovi TaxID=2213046 RepID=UPI00117E5EA5|nr:universal stress protein [Robertkochia solimangrovi]TRZ41795.1 hypothetical protein DMZ48_15735 [Robertkochia solimangrovi]